MTRQSPPTPKAALAARIAACAAEEHDIIPMPDTVIERVAAMLRPIPTTGDLDEVATARDGRAPV